MNRKTIFALIASVLACATAVADVKLTEPNAVPTMGDVKLQGPFGERLDKLIRNHVERTDVRFLTDLYRNWKVGADEGFWHTEFWGKYMHAAVPLMKYADSAVLKEKMSAAFENLLKAQEECGYLGAYPESWRLDAKWSVWGQKYTLLGLLYHYEGFKDARALEAAKRLCDYLIREIGPDGRRGVPLHLTGKYGALPSCSLLAPVVWLYRVTREKRYLEFADYIVREMCEPKDGPQLVKMAEVPVADRRMEEFPAIRRERGDKQPEALVKAYECMSCYQGLIAYALATGRDECLRAAVKTADSIARDEVNLAGGASAGEFWFHGAEQQWRHISWQQETCVITTWMRLCETLLTVTGDPKWADQLEKTFYNAYLASMTSEADAFAAYTPLMGYRSRGHHHCRTYLNCCNANGPRGYLTVLDSLVQAKGDRIFLNLYISGNAAMRLPGTGKEVRLQTYTTYPRTRDVTVWYQSPCEQEFSLMLRIPAFSAKTQVKVNGQHVAGTPKAGSYFEIRRTWKNTDRLEVRFDLPVEMHRLHDHVAFTRGPICLARDSRFGDGALDEQIRANKITPRTLAAFEHVRSDDPSVMMAFAAAIPSGYHDEDPDNGLYPSTIHFCDYASAGNLWRPDNRYRLWLPELIPGRQQ